MRRKLRWRCRIKHLFPVDECHANLDRMEFGYRHGERIAPSYDQVGVHANLD